MIAKAQIKAMLVTYWSSEDECYVTQSAAIPHVITGIGESSEEAESNFESILEEIYDEITSDNLAGYKQGRPAKGYIPFNTNIRATSKEAITMLAGELKISQGEVIDLLVFFRECKLQEVSPAQNKDELISWMKDMRSEVKQISEKLDRQNLQHFNQDQRLIREVLLAATNERDFGNSPNIYATSNFQSEYANQDFQAYIGSHH